MYKSNRLLIFGHFVPKAGCLTTSLDPAQCWSNGTYHWHPCRVFSLQDTDKEPHWICCSVPLLPACLPHQKPFFERKFLNLEFLSPSSTWIVLQAFLPGFPRWWSRYLTAQTELTYSRQWGTLGSTEHPLQAKQSNQKCSTKWNQENRKWIHFLQADISLALQHAATMFQAGG